MLCCEDWKHGCALKKTTLHSLKYTIVQDNTILRFILFSEIIIRHKIDNIVLLLEL